MHNKLLEIISKIEVLNPLHAKRLRNSVKIADKTYFERANQFLDKYIKYLNSIGKDLDYAVTCYLKMVGDFQYEQIRFFETGEYSCKSFKDAEERVYSNIVVMDYYMQGLILSQFLWMHHYGILCFFVDFLPAYKKSVKNYLEIGAGHGLFISNACKSLNCHVEYDVVDVSETSIKMAHKFIDSTNINFIRTDILNYAPERKYDFITMGEVLEHVESPLQLMNKLSELLHPDGHIFLSVPINAPAIDHIYLFRNADEIRELLEETGFEIVKEKTFQSEDIDPVKVQKLRVPVMYGVFIKKSKDHGRIGNDR